MSHSSPSALAAAHSAKPIARTFSDSKARAGESRYASRPGAAGTAGQGAALCAMRRPMNFSCDAYVTAALFDANGEAVFALGDGQVRWAGGAGQTPHDGPVLAAVRHPTAEGVITGGDDGRLVWSRRDGLQVLAEAKGHWIESIAAQPGVSTLAFGAGREARVIDLAD